MPRKKRRAIRRSPPTHRIRIAGPPDDAGLAALEARCFATDRLTRRQFRHFLTRGNAAILVAGRGSTLRGYALVLFRRGTSLARLYSLAVDPAARGQGLARRLLKSAEEAARTAGAAVMRLEVRPDNTEAIRLYEEAGYRAFGRFLDFYEDRSEALRFEKDLEPELAGAGRIIPFYGQTTDFTCGPAALLMAMSALDESIKPSRRLELRLWRESTTIFMTAGHGGCGPFGLALAAHGRGFRVRIFVSDLEPLFLDTVRSARKKEVMRLVQEDFRAEVAETDITVTHRGLGLPDLTRALSEGGVPLVLVSAYRMYEQRVPHWLVILGVDERFVHAHDPWFGVEEEFVSRADRAN
ncbi:MAG: GNAT family N-acetyltransferase/peptidase C39 family protein, partial [Gemmatimonadales bacterium]